MQFVNVFLDKRHKTPLYLQLYRHLAGQIRAGKLQKGERLPGKRAAAAQLGVSVNTVNEAYQMLAAEGYLLAKPRSGFVVARLDHQLPQLGGQSADAPPPERPQPVWRYSFASGGIDTSLFPRKTWNRLQREVLAAEDDLFEAGEAAGEAVLRSAIAEYLQGFRGVRCEAGQVVLGAGLEVLLAMLARLYAGKTVAVEDPGYPKTPHILRNVGVAVRQVQADEQGMRPDLLAQSGAQLVYLTPSHQFPTGVAMPVGRRMELLRWAGARGRLIIEDDYDSEFRFDGRPLPSLQGLAEGHHVVYAGTFSRSLAPGLRIAYLVLPPLVLAKWQQAYSDYSCTVSRPEQQTLARLMAGGHFSRSLNRARASYKTRRGLLLAALEQGLGTEYCTENIHTGLYFILRLPGHNALEVARSARAAGIRLRALDEYRHGSTPGQSPTADALVMGYGGLPNDAIPAAVQALSEVLRQP